MTDYPHVTIHEFKTKISKYIRLLNAGKHRAVIVCRHKKPVGLFMTVDRPKEKTAASAPTSVQSPDKVE